MKKRKTPIQWVGVDWSKNNAQIARDLDADTSTVRRKRRKLGLPPSKRIQHSGIEEIPGGSAVDWDRTIRFNDGKCTRRKYCLRCKKCKEWRMVRTVNIGKIRKGKMSVCYKCSRTSPKTNTYGKHYNSSGYIICLLSLFSEEEQKILKPMSCERKDTSTAEISEHRAIMALNLGRPLKTNEIVHHINGIKDDNRIENLEFLSRSNHAKEHKEILKSLKRVIRENQLLKEKIKELSV